MKHPSPMPCNQVENLIPLYVGEDDLDLPQARLVREHLAACAGCAAIAEAAARARSALVALRGPSASGEVDLWRPIRAVLASEGRIGAAQTIPQRVSARRRASLARWLPAAAAAAAAVLVAIALEMGARDDAAPLGGTPKLAAPVVAVDGAGEAPVPGGLRRALPWEERLRDSAQLFPAGFAPAPLHGAPLRATPRVTPVGWSPAGQQ